jgi:hypothetical protein
MDFLRMAMDQGRDGFQEQSALVWTIHRSFPSQSARSMGNVGDQSSKVGVISETGLTKTHSHASVSHAPHGENPIAGVKAHIPH